jgi:acyl carrier protein
MTADEILSRLRGELKRTRPAIPDDIPASSDFQLDWHLDSLDLVEFVSRLETAFSLQIPDEDFRHLVSLTATADYIQRRITHSTQPITVGDDRSYVRHRPHDDEQRRSHAMTYPRTAASDRIVITGVGVLSPLGQNVPDLWARLLAGDSCARPWSDLAADGYRVSTACRIESLDYPPLRRGRTLAIAAATQAVHHAALQVPPSTGVFIGSTMGESFAFEAAAEGRRLRLGDYSVQSFTRGLQRHFRLQGIGVSLGTACAAGNYAVGAAMAALRKRQVSVALAGGVEPFSRLALVGFSRSRAMAQTACRPFDRNRSGMLLGEGAAVFVLERAEDASRRGITPRWTLAEYVLTKSIG